MPKKQLSQAVIPVDAECWAEVLIDFEGPFQPADKDGNHYNFTYMCAVCSAVLLDAVPIVNSHNARRAFACCVFRSGRFPNLCNSDRGPELKNAIMQEYAALTGIGRRFGTPYRPVEQGKVEEKHKLTPNFMVC